ncbi:restriction endonuclease subunit S, partial [Thiolapillus sp.]|uniref:restriction endonuclease subunit S n=1 Tax=Thiolapillus sp. TaxID=2017437 RepID=UPI0025EC053D
MVPEGWKITSLGEVCDGNLQTGPFGSQLHANEYTASGIPVLMPKDFVDGKVNISDAAKISHKRASDLSKHRLQAGDLLFSRRGDVTRFALITEELAGALCGTGCLRARPSSKHTPAFLAYFLQKNAVRKWLEQNAVGQTMPNMNTAILSELPLMVSTSTSEEEKIARILSTWDKAIETVKKLIENSKAQKKALMQQLLTGKRRLPGFDEEWKTIRLDDVLDGKKRKGKIVPTNDEKRGVAYIGSTSFNGDFGIYTDSSDAVICSPKDILV